MRSTAGSRPRWRGGAVVLLALALSGCGILHERAQEQGPQSRPAGDEGMLLFTVGRLSFEAPAAWPARGDPRRS
jgi:hypothetical protein